MPNNQEPDCMPPEAWVRHWRLYIDYDGMMEEVRQIVREELEARLVRRPDENGVTAVAGKC